MITLTIELPTALAEAVSELLIDRRMERLLDDEVRRVCSIDWSPEAKFGERHPAAIAWITREGRS